MTNIKRISAIILSIIMLISAFPMTASAKTAAPAKPTSLSATTTTSAVTLNWKKVSKASGYTVYKYDTKKKKYSTVKTVKKNTLTIKKLKSATTYVYAVKAYKTDKKKKVYSKYSSKLTVSTATGKPGSFKIGSRSNNAVSASWSKVKNASGYTFDYSTDKSFKSNVKSVNTTALKASATGLAATSTYYFRVRAYRTAGKKKWHSASSTVLTSNATQAPSAPAQTQEPANLSAVNTSQTYQTIDGFGAAGCWWVNYVGYWSKNEISNVMKYLYSPTEGIGLNIYRYNIGAGSKDDEQMYEYFKRTESFLKEIKPNGELVYDWSADEAARKCLRIAKQLAGDNLRVSFFVNSPPTQLTKNGKAYCNCNFDAEWYWGWESNFDDKITSNITKFVKYNFDIADHFVSEGYRVTDLCPVNEPNYDWAAWQNEDSTFAMNQEGCHYKPEAVKKIFSAMAKEERSNPRSYRISMYEAGKAEPEYYNGGLTAFSDYLNTIMSDTFNKNYYNSVSVHSYWTPVNWKQASKQYVDSKFPGMTFACTEYMQMVNDGNNGVWWMIKQNVDKAEAKRAEGDAKTAAGDAAGAAAAYAEADAADEARRGYTIDYGVQMAKVINTDLTVLNATEWNWWTAVASNNFPEALVYVRDEDGHRGEVKLPKRLWCLGNYSKFIKEGAKRVQVTEKQSGLLSSAYVNPDGSLVIVYVNAPEVNSSQNGYEYCSDKTVNISAPGYSNYAVYETSSARDLQYTQGGGFNSGNNSVYIPSNSVVSVILTK